MRNRCPHCDSGSNNHAESCPKYVPLAWENRRNIVAYNALCHRPECIALFPRHGRELWQQAPEPVPIINTLRREESPND